MAIKEMCWAATEAVLADKNILILSDRAQGPDRIPMPALLATAAVHHHLVRQGLRMQTGLVVETGEAREVHHFCVLAGYGAEAINPYVALRNAGAHPGPQGTAARRQAGQEELHQGGRQGHPEGHVQDGHLDLPVLLRRADLRRGRPVERFIDKYFTGTATTIEGAALPQSPRKPCAATAPPMATIRSTATCSMLAACTSCACAARNTPGLRPTSPACSTRCAATCLRSMQGIRAVDQRPVERMLTIRGLMEFKKADKPLDISEVEPASEIVKRFATGAMSYGSISWEAHTTLAWR
jgi:glutamate synthase (NADPH/NADH) large chain